MTEHSTTAPSRPDRQEQAGSGFLAEASRLLAESLDYEDTLATVAGLSLPYLGAWCIVDVYLHGEMRRAAVIHSDPEMEALARRLEGGWPPEQGDPIGIPRAIRTRETEIIAELPDETLVAVSHSEENLQILRALGMGSLLVVPLLARGDVLGAITYVSPRDGRAHGAEDVDLAEDLAARCAIALDNARLYQGLEGARARAEEALQVAEAARAEAEEANEVKTLFLQTMSHELRTPLNAIAAYVDILQAGIHGPLTERQREDLRRVAISHRHLLSLIEQVLDYARTGAYRMQYDTRSVAISAVVEETEVVITPVSRAKDIDLVVLKECTGADVVVGADPNKLAQILVNLLSNAVKFTRPGGRVELMCEERDECVHLRVRDTGVGIAPEDQERIFEPFVQLQNGLTRNENGTGLGLAISRDFARAMGGNLVVESTPGEGSTFTLTLPRGEPAEDGPHG